MSGFLLDSYPAGTVIKALFNTYNSSGASVTVTGLAAADIEIYANGSTTQRSSDNGYTVDDDFDSITGIHLISIDLGDNTDAGFYAVGSQYNVVLASITVDSQTVNFVLGTFRITTAETTAGAVPATLAVGAIANSAITAAAIATDAITVDKIAANSITSSELADGAITAAKFGASAITSTVLANDCITDAKVASDVTIASVTGAVGSVTGSVGGNVTGSVGSITTGGIAAASFAAGAINAAAIADGAIDAGAIASAAITAAKFDTDAITSTVLAASATSEIATAVLTTQMTESYAANGVAPTMAQAQFAIHQMLMSFAISGTTYTVRQLNGSTTAFLVTLNSATAPTSAARS